MNTRHLGLLPVFISFLVLQLNILAQQQSVVIPESVGMSSARLEYLTNTFEEYVDNGDLPGAVVLVMRHGKVAYFESFGERDIENDIPMEGH